MTLREEWRVWERYEMHGLRVTRQVGVFRSERRATEAAAYSAQTSPRVWVEHVRTTVVRGRGVKR